MRIYSLYTSNTQPAESTQNNFTKAYFFTHKEGEDFKALECLSDECFGTINEFKVVHYEEAKQKALDLGFIKLDSFNLESLGLTQEQASKLNQNDMNNITNATLSAGISFLMKFAQTQEQAKAILEEAFQQQIEIPLSDGTTQSFTIYQLSEIQKQVLQNKLQLEAEQNKQLEGLKNNEANPQQPTEGGTTAEGKGDIPQNNATADKGDNTNGNQTEQGTTTDETTNGSDTNSGTDSNSSVSSGNNSNDLQTGGSGSNTDPNGAGNQESNATDSTTDTGANGSGTDSNTDSNNGIEVGTESAPPIHIKDLPNDSHPSDWNEILDLSMEELAPRINYLFNYAEGTKEHHNAFNGLSVMAGLVAFQDNANSGNNLRVLKNSKEQNLTLAKIMLRQARLILDPLVYGYFDNSIANVSKLNAFKGNVSGYLRNINYTKPAFTGTLFNNQRYEEALAFELACYHQGNIITAVVQATHNQIWYGRNAVYDYAPTNDTYGRHAKQRFSSYVTAGVSDIVDKAGVNRATREYITEDTMQFLNPETLAYILPTKGR